jgi:DNA-directed RNA polymerase subunit beta'
MLNNLFKQNSLNTFFTSFFKIKKCNNIYKSTFYDIILLQSNNKIILLKKLLPLNIYKNSLKSIVQEYNFIKLGSSINKGIITSDRLLNLLYYYHLMFDSLLTSYINSISKLQFILLNSLQSIYKTQDIQISNIHFEIIIKQMTSQIKILNSGDTPFVIDELVKYSLFEQILFVLDKKYYKLPFFKPILVGMTKGSIINNNSFITNAGFQETKNILIKAAIEGNKDWLRGLRECLTIGRLASSGTTFLNYKNYLDTIYLFKNFKTLSL